MRRGAWLACVLLVLGGAARAADGLMDLARNAEDQLEAWDIEGGTRVLAQMESRAKDRPETLWVKGRVLFEEGRYEDADRAFALAEEGAGGALRFAQERKLARAAAEEVRGSRLHESAHFLLRTKAAKDALLAPYALAALERAWEALTQDLGYAPPGKVRIEVYDTPQALARVSPLSVAEIKASGTIALCKYNRLMITSPRALLRGYPWLDTVSHEFVHYLVTRKGRNTAPIWLQEGLAKFLETRWRGEPGLAVDEASLALLLRAARQKQLIPFAAMHPSIAKLPTQEKAALAFAEVEAAIRLLYLRGGQKALTDLVAALAGGASDEQAVAQAYGKSFGSFEADWRAEVAKPRPHGGAAAVARGERPANPRKLVFKEDVRRRPGKEPEPRESREPDDVEARRAARLGELFLARRRWGAAAQEYRKARERAGEELPVLSRRYAFAELQLGHLDAAAEALAAATRKDPLDEAAQALYARVLFARGDGAGARAALEAGVAVDPFDPDLHAVWIELARREKDRPVEAREQRALALCLDEVAPAEPEKKGEDKGP